MNMMMKRTNSQTSQENLPFANATGSEANQRRSALGDISSMVSNVSSAASLGGKMPGVAPFNFAQKFANLTTSGRSANTARAAVPATRAAASAALQPVGHFDRDVVVGRPTSLSNVPSALLDGDQGQSETS